MMHILLLCHHYRPEIGAPQRRWDAFVSEWRRAGHAVTVITALPHYPVGRLLPDQRVTELLGAREGEHGERVVRVPFLPVGDRGGVAKLANQAVVAAWTALVAPWVDAPDVVVSSVPGPATLAAADAMSAWFRVPHVLELRDAWPDLLAQGAPDADRVPLGFDRWMTGRQRAADAVVSVTSSFADVLVRRGVHHARVHHVSNGIDSSTVPKLDPPASHDGRLRVLYLGTHGVSQALDNAVRALALVPDHVKARFIGNGTERQSLQELANELNAPVTFLDAVRGEELWDAYRWADTCLVHLDAIPAFEHTVPSKLYEVMALGRHVTGALFGEAARIVEDAEGGDVVPPGDPRALADALRTLARNRKRLVVGSHPRAWVEANADLRPLAHRFLDIIDHVVPACD